LGRNNAPLLDEIAWYGGNSGQGYELEVGEDSSDWPEKQYPHTKAGSRPVATRGPNPFGLYDMLGNVLEICADNLTPYSPDARTDPPPRKDAGTKRVIRGGAWGAFAGFVRAATRIEWRPKGRDSNFGFRLARGPAPGQAGLDPVTPRSGGPEAAEGRGRPVPAARDATPARARKREGR
jgi:formylglycine-generating enzyme required for sulfatase activity